MRAGEAADKPRANRRPRRPTMPANNALSPRAHEGTVFFQSSQPVGIQL